MFENLPKEFLQRINELMHCELLMKPTIKRCWF